MRGVGRAIRTVGEWGSACSIAMIALAWAADVRSQPVQAADDERTATLCMACHRDKFEAREANPHVVLDSEPWRARSGFAVGCSSCHGDVTAHIAAGGGAVGVFAFRLEPAPAQNQACLGCHQTTHPRFDSSPHARAGLSCATCHSQHGSGADPAPLALLREPGGLRDDFDATGATSRLCADCHSDILTAVAFNEHHRLREGILECTSCHDPHALATRSLLGGFKQQQCLECHTDKGGPFVFEHAASRFDGCTACHSPHGSPNRHMLAHERVAELCFTCHAAVPQFHLGFAPSGPSRFGLDTQCTNCHSAIHGSSFDPFFLR